MRVVSVNVGLPRTVSWRGTIVRAVLLPATMKLLGDWNSYLPRWLEWLPRLSRDGAPACSPETDAASA